MTVQLNSRDALFAQNYGKALLVPSRMATRSHKNYFQRHSRYVRDVQMWDLPLVGAAAVIYQQLCSTREWQVTGPVRQATRAVEFINNAKVLTRSGYIYTGFEDFLSRRCIDYLAVGRTAFSYNTRVNSPVLEYIDPTYLYLERTNMDQVVTPNEKVWRYEVFTERRLAASDIHLNHPIPIGAQDYFVAPMEMLLPAGLLAWLLREHDTAALDGRKIREILLVGSEQIQDVIEEGIKSLVALHSGADPTKVGVPVVAIQNLTGQPISNQIAQIGLSSIPENFDRNKFMFEYANNIAATFGLPLREFWNEESTTNRALEQIQEQRGQRKGPSAFIRSEERIMNQSGILNQFGRKVFFHFVEEYDTASQKTNAEVLKFTADAMAQFSAVFGVQLDLRAVEAWLQSIHVLPADLELVLNDAPLEQQEHSIQNPDAQPTPSGENERIVSGDEPSTTVQKAKHFIPEYGEVTLDSSGRVIEKRLKTFSIPDYLAQVMLQNNEVEVPPTPSSEVFDDVVEQVSQDNLSEYKRLWQENSSDIVRLIKEQKLYTVDEIQSAHLNAISDMPLPDSQQTIIDFLLESLNG